MAASPLYQQEIKIPSWKSPSLTTSCQMVGGSNAVPQNFKSDKKMTGLKHNDRISRRTKMRHRGITDIALTSGKTAGAKSGINQHALYSGREKRSLAARVLRERGIPVTKASIDGILSGKTL